jgi:hypothetical protein
LVIVTTHHAQQDMHSVSTHLALVATASLLLVVATVLHLVIAHALAVETAQHLVIAEVVLHSAASLHLEVVHHLVVLLALETNLASAVETVLHSVTVHALVVETAQHLVTAEVVLQSVIAADGHRSVVSLHSEVVHHMATVLLLVIALVTKIAARVLHTILIVLHSATALALETNHVSETSLASVVNHHSMVSAKTNAQSADTSHLLELAPHRGTMLQIGTMITSPATTHTTHRLSFQTFFAS